MNSPAPRALRFGPLADQSFALFTRQFFLILDCSRVYFSTFWICLALLLLALPKLSGQIPPALLIGVWVCLCVPLWQWTLRPLGRFFRSGPESSTNFWIVPPLMVLNLVPWLFFRRFALVFTLQSVEGLDWKAAAHRSRTILRERGSFVVGLLAAWLTLPWLLAESLKFLVESCLPWIWGVFDFSVDIQLWAQPALLASRCVLASLVMPGFELSLGLLCQEYAHCREGTELLAALEQEYGP